MTRRLALVGLAVCAFHFCGPIHAATIGDVGNLIATVGGGGVAEFDGSSGNLLGSLLTAQPIDFAFDGSLLYTTDPSDHIITYDSFTGAVVGVLAGPTVLMNAGSIQVAPDGTIVVVNRLGGGTSVDRFSTTGVLIQTISTEPINDFVYGPNGNIYATSAADEVIEIRPSDGVVLDVLTTAIVNPGSLLFLNDGSLIVRESTGVLRFSEAGASLGIFTTSLSNDLTLGPDGNVYSTDPSDSILVFDGTTGSSLGTFASTPANPSTLAFRPVPEPSTALLLALGLPLLGAVRIGRR